MIAALLIAIFGLSVFDAAYTVQQLQAFGPEIELNPIIRGLVKPLGLPGAIAAGIWGPTGTLCLLGMKWPLILWIMTAVKTWMFEKQIRRMYEIR